MDIEIPKPPQTGDLEELSRLIAGSDFPRWLVEHFRQWAPSVMLDRFVHIAQPTKKEMKKQLVEVQRAAALLEQALGRASILEFLHLPPHSAFGADALTRDLQDLRARAATGIKSSYLSGKDGTTPAGRQKALIEGAYSAEVYCAMLIAESWKYFHREYPAPANRVAAAAADKLWEMTGGERDAWGTDRLRRWRNRFIKAAQLNANENREEYQRHLREAARFAELTAKNQAEAGGI